MNSIKIKICGLTTQKDIEIVNKAKPTYAGFIFAPSRRIVEVNAAKQLIESLDKNILPVGVFVNETVKRIVEITLICKLKVIQLHGQENTNTIADLKKTLQSVACNDVEVWKAVRVKDETFLAEIEMLMTSRHLQTKKCCNSSGRDFIVEQDVSQIERQMTDQLPVDNVNTITHQNLYDNRCFLIKPNDEPDRILLDAWNPSTAGGSGKIFNWNLLNGLSIPFILAGGLTPENIEEAIDTMNPWGVDVSSGVEADGSKSEEKVMIFTSLVRNAC